MKLKLITSVLTLALSIGLASAQPVPVLPENLTWFGPPNNPDVRGAWVIGHEKEVGPYLFRVKLAKGGRLLPHTHPDTRNTTVLSGTLYVGFGERFDESKLVAIPAGGVYIAPAGLSHFLLAKDGDVVYQEGGTGPTSTDPTKP